MAEVVLGDTIVLTWQAADDDRVPTATTGTATYRVYDDAGYMNLTGSVAAVDAANVTGLYGASIDATEANGFEAGKTYGCRVQGTVAGKVRAEVIPFGVV